MHFSSDLVGRGRDGSNTSDIEEIHSDVRNRFLTFVKQLHDSGGLLQAFGKIVSVWPLLLGRNRATLHSS